MISRNKERSCEKEGRRASDQGKRKRNVKAKEEAFSLDIQINEEERRN